MTRVNEIIGKPVFANKTGENLDIIIEDIIFNEQRLLGFIVRKIGSKKNGFILPFKRVIKIDKNAVFTEVIDLAKENISLKDGFSLLFQNQNIIKKNGKKLGKMVDLYFDTYTGKIQGYEVSCSRLINVTESLFICAVETEIIAENYVKNIYEAKAVNTLITNLINTARQQNKQDFSSTNLSQKEGLMTEAHTSQEVKILEQLYQTGGDNSRAKKDAEKTRQKFAQVTKNQQNSRVIVAANEMGDKEGIEGAKVNNQEKNFFKAVGLASARRSINKINTNKMPNYYQSQENITQQEKKIRWALGRPVIRVILDKQNNVILKIGDLINYQAVERAKQAGVLDFLLSSVYYKK